MIILQAEHPKQDFRDNCTDEICGGPPLTQLMPSKASTKRIMARVTFRDGVERLMSLRKGTLASSTFMVDTKYGYIWIRVREITI
ncbi:hypothetical protein P5V15_001517 [Pogonomyrmex californicus]